MLVCVLTTDLILHRAESHHAKLKKQLQTSMGDLETCWTNIHTLMEATHNAIKGSFEKSINVIQHKYRRGIYQSIRGFVSTTALQLIHDEIQGLPEGVMDATDCECVLRKTCGLPCAHELSEYVSKGLPIQLDEIDDYWRKLDCTPRNMEGDKRADIKNKLKEFLKKMESTIDDADYSRQEFMFRRLQEMVNPSTTLLTEPKEPKATRGRPKISKKKGSTKRDPSAFELPMSEVKSSPNEGVVYAAGPVAPVPMFTSTKPNRPMKQRVSIVLFKNTFELFICTSSL